ncbi:MAG: M16 family metallopeptidase [Armatimonadota bacterium]
MTRQLSAVGALLMLWVPAACAQPLSPIITRMGNGLTAILVEDHSAELVAVDVWVKAGSGNESTKNNGVSHFIEHLVFGATQKRQPGEMDLEMESVGAVLNAHTSRDWAHFATTVSSRYLTKALDVLADALTNAQFREADFSRERLVLLEELRKLEADPIEVCKTAIAAEVFGSHPYGLPVQGTPDTIRTISRQDVLDYYRKYYVPKNTAVVLVGDIDPQQALAEIGRAFQGYSNVPMPESVPSEIRPITAQVNKRIESNFRQTYLTIGFLGPPGNDYADVCATDVLLAHMGFGYRSWLDQELARKMGLATATSADFLTQKHRGMITIFAATTEANLDKVKGTIFAKIGSLRSEGIPEPDLAVAKRSVLGRYAFQNETYSGMANSLGFYFAVSEPEFAVNYVNCVQAVTNQDIIRISQKYLDPARAVVLVLAPKAGGAQ